MAVHSEPRIRTFKSEGVIRPYRYVKWGAAAGGMLECDANEKSVGIYQGETTLASGDFGDVALPGGGALLEVSETITAGKFLTPTADGLGEVVDAAAEFYGSVAQESAVASDIIGVEVIATAYGVASDA